MADTENRYWSDIKSRFEQEEDLCIFKTWDVVRYVPIYADYQFQEFYGPQVVSMIESGKTDIEKTVWRDALKEPFDGHTKESYAKIQYNVSGYETSPWVLKSAHHIATFLTHNAKRLSDFDQIVEFGPGIGELARVVCSLGFKGDYFLYDLPEVARISSYYNRNNLNVKKISHYSQVDPSKRTLFISTWAISEAPFELRDYVFTYFRDADYLLIYQNNVFQYDNVQYFNDRFPRIITKEYETIDIEFLNHIAGGNHYIITK